MTQRATKMGAMLRLRSILLLLAVTLSPSAWAQAADDSSTANAPTTGDLDSVDTAAADEGSGADANGSRADEGSADAEGGAADSAQRAGDDASQGEQQSAASRGDESPNEAGSLETSSARSASTPSEPSTTGKQPYASMSDQELRQKLDSTSTGGGIAMTVSGAVIGSVSVQVFFVAGLLSLICDDDFDDCSGVNTTTAVSGVVTLASGAMLVGGVIWLHNSQEKQRDIRNELSRRESSASLSWGLQPRRGGASLVLQGRF